MMKTLLFPLLFLALAFPLMTHPGNLFADPPPSILVDNRSARFVGSSWETGDTSEDRHGPDYHYSLAGDENTYAQFSVNIPETGFYDVYEWHSEGTNRTSAADIHIRHAEGTSRTQVNQKTGGGRWNLIGRFVFNKGAESFLKVTARIPPRKDEVVMADAFRLDFAAPLGQDPAEATSRERFVAAPVPAPVPASSMRSPASIPQSEVRTPQTKRIRPFGEYVQEVIDELEARKRRDGGGYLMRDMYGKYTGVTETLRYRGTDYMWNECKKGEKVRFEGSSKTYEPWGHSYCSGLTLEIFHKAMKKRDRDLGIPESRENWNGLGPKGIFIFKKLWNVIDIRYSDTGRLVTSRPRPAKTLEMSGLGRIITWGESSKFEQVRKYDFCDISRTDNTGHSIIFISWIRSKKDKRIIGLRYYSTQKSTKGQGYNEEYFQGSGGKIIKTMFFAGRVYDDPREWKTNQIREAGYK